MKQAFLGIDISKKTFDVALLIEDKIKSKKFNNSNPGFNNLLKWLSAKEVTLEQACMEATGVYGEALAEFLYSKKIAISVVNPARIKGFAQSELARCKNDILDAKLIARFCKLIRPNLWEPTPEHIKELQHWVRRLDDLIKMHRQEANRLEVSGDCLKQYIEKHINDLELQMDEAKTMIRGIIEKYPDLKEKDELLQSIPGIGNTTTAHVLAFIGNIEKFDNAKQVAAFVGLNPKHHQSGTSIKGKSRLSKTGNAALRKALYMPALVAIRHNPILKEFSNRLEQAGKHKMEIIGAVMRKLIHMIYGILKTKTMFNASIV